jgi:DNA-binding transcriptional LysR family regulator
MLDVRRLRLLRELEARGTIIAVADALAYTPSAVSQQLQQLEREAGVPLLERAGRRVRLTEAARTLVEHTEAVLARLELAEADLAASAGRVVGRVRIAAFQTAARELVAPALVALAGRHPQLRGELLEIEAEEGLPRLRLGDLDVVVAEEYEHAPRPRDPGLERVPLCRDPILLALPPDHPAAAAGRPVTLAELAGDAWASTRPHTAFSDMLLRACRSLGGFEPDVRHRANDTRILMHLAAAGLAVAFVPGMARPGEEPGIALRQLAHPSVARRVFAAVRAGSAAQPAIAAALAALREAAAALGLPEE